MKRTTNFILWLLVATSLTLATAACKAKETPSPTPTSEADSSVFTSVYPPEDQSEPETVTLEGATVTESGLQFLELLAGEGDSPQEGDIVEMHFIGTLPDDTEFVNTYREDQTIKAIFGRDQLLPGWEEGLALMKAGGKARMVIPPELGFGASGYGIVPPNSQIILEVELITVSPAPQPSTVAEEDLTTTDSGLQYYDLVVGEGAEALDGYTVTTHFSIWVQSDSGDRYVASSTDRDPLSFVIGRGDTVFPGWEEGALHMNIGGKRLLIIPPALALGDSASGEIPANATLIMEIELVDAREPRLPVEVDEKDYILTDSGLKYYDLLEGEGPSPEAGQTVIVHYTGWLEDGTQFDSSVDRGQPFSFALGTGGVIPGWDEGVATMKVGGKRQLVIPPELGYGDVGAGNVIPPGATLVFEVELLEIQP